MAEVEDEGDLVGLSVFVELFADGVDDSSVEWETYEYGAAVPPKDMTMVSVLAANSSSMSKPPLSPFPAADLP